MKKITLLLLATMLSINTFSQFQGNQTSVELFGSVNYGASYDYTNGGVLTLYAGNYKDSVNFLEDAKAAGGPIVIRRDGYNLAIEKRDTIPSSDIDTTYLIWDHNIIANVGGRGNFQTIQYFKLVIVTNLWRLDAGGHELAAYLDDYYLGIRTPINMDSVGINDTTIYTFTVGIPDGYSDSDRFAIIYHDPIVPLTPLVPYSSIITPVTFVSIHANRHDNNIYVSWDVENEVNIKDYQVQRSIDGKHFETVSVIYPTKSNQYQFTDLSALQNNLYYRIESVDINGKVGYSSIAEVGAESTNYGISAFPNPVSAITNIKFDKKGNYLVQLYNVNGQQLFNTRKILSTDNGKLSVDMSKYENGFYYLKITNGSVQNSLKLIKR